MNVIVLFVLATLMVATLPVFPYSRGWGYYPGSVVACLLVTVVALMML